MSLPDSIGDLSSLAFLYLPNNNLKSLPKTIKNLRSLQQLTLSNNRYLYSIEPLNGLPSLRILNTRHCPILVLPQNLPQLTDLYMSNNSLTKLAAIETLGTATNNKKSFYFDMNYIESVPPQIQEVKNLFWLTLNQNKLKDLPTDIFKVTTLSYLNIQRNDFDQRDLKTIVFNFHNSNPNVSILYK
jgi:Leucine-rich repeat (LRR) protein